MKKLFTHFNRQTINNSFQANGSKFLPKGTFLGRTNLFNLTKLILIVILICFPLLMQKSWGQLVTYTPTSLAVLPSTTVTPASNFTANPITTGGGFSAGSCGSGSYFHRAGVNVPTNTATATTSGTYYEFTVAANSGYSATYTSVSISNVRNSTSASVPAIKFSYKIGSGSFNDDPLLASAGTGNCSSVGNTYIYDFTDFSSSQTITFRIYIYSGSTSASSYRFGTITVNGSVTSACTPPVTQATIGSYTSTGTTSTTVNWTRGSGDSVLVVGRLTTTTAVAPSSGTTYSANAAFGSGTTTGTGNYVVYKSVGTTVPVTALAAATNYTFTVYEFNSSSTCYKTPGSSSAISTNCSPPVTQASIGAYTNNTTGNSLTANWTRGSGDSILVVGRLTSTTAVAPTSGTNYSANAAFGLGSTTATGNYVVYKGTGTTVPLTGLTLNSNYTFTIYEYNGTGICYNISGSSSSITTICTPPVTQASINAYSNNTTGNSLTANWSRGNGTAGVIVVARLTTTIAIDPISDNTYTANAAFGSGTGSAITGTGNYVVYVGTGTSVPVTALSGNTNYTFTVYEYNTGGPCYLIPGSSSSVLTPLIYCTSTGTMIYQTGITYVGFNTISNATPTKTAGYNDYTSQSTTVTQNSNINLNVRANTAGTYNVYCKAWIDWNKDGVFNTTNEEYTLGTTYNVTDGSLSLSPLSINIPSSASIGNTRMRVSIKYSSSVTYPTSCETSMDGEVEDYQIIVAASCVPTITLGTNTVDFANVCATIVKVPIQSFSLTSSSCDGNLTNVGFTTTGTYTSSEVTKFQLWKSATNDISTATQLGADLTTSLGAGAHTFAAFTSPTLTNGTPYYFWITADVASSITDGHTIAVNAIATTDLTSTSTKAGSTTAGGTLTLKALPTAPIVSSPICAGVTSVSGTSTEANGTVIALYKGAVSQGTTTVASNNWTVSGISALVGGDLIKATATSSSGCVSSFSSIVTVTALPAVPTAGNNGLVNQGTTLSLTASTISGATYSWTGPYGFTSTSQNPTVSTSATTAMAGTYNVTATVNGCSGSAGSTNVIVTNIPSLSIGAITDFGNICINNSSSPNSFTVYGINLTTADISIAALNGYSYSTSLSGTYSSTLTISQSGGTYGPTPVYVKLSPTSVQSYNGSIVVGGAGATDVNRSVTGSGINTASTVTTTSPATLITATSVTLSGNVTDAGCQTVTSRGICYGTSLIPDLTGIFISETGTIGSFSSNISNLLPNTLYHFRAYSTSSAGTSYGSDVTFTTDNLTAPTATDATSLTSSGFTATWSSLTGANVYKLDVSNSPTFSSTGVINEGFENPTFPPTGWITTGWSRSTATNDYASGVAGAICGSTSGTLTTNAIAYPTSMTFYLGRSSNTTTKTLTIEVSTTSQSSGFSTIATFDHSNVPASSYNQYSINLSAYSSNSIIYIRFNKSSTTTSPWRLDDIVINESAPSFISGYYDLNVNTTSQAVSGLNPITNYYYRVRAVGGNSTSVNSNVITALTTPVSATASTTVQPTCTVPTGTIVVTSPLGAYEYNIDGGTYQSSVTFYNVAAGDHSILVRSATVPISISTATIVTVNAQPQTPPAPTVGSITQPTCTTSTGSVVLNDLPSGNWTINPGSISGSSSSKTISGLAASHTYNYTVTNNLGCTSLASANVVIDAQPVSPMASITNNTGSTILTCARAVINVTATGGVTYAWSGGATPSTDINSITTPATYTVTVTTANGCTDTKSITITQDIAKPTAGITNNSSSTILTCV
ncbi:MAG: GEVED domain-containing protein, partial [Bacteroidota bacterium]